MLDLWGNEMFVIDFYKMSVIVLSMKIMMRGGSSIRSSHTEGLPTIRIASSYW